MRVQLRHSHMMEQGMMQQEHPPPPSPHSMHGRLDLTCAPPLPAEDTDEDVVTDTEDPVVIAEPLEGEPAGCAIF